MNMPDENEMDEDVDTDDEDTDDDEADDDLTHGTPICQPTGLTFSGTTGTVTVSPAPTDASGQIVYLFSSNTNIATVPLSVTVAQNQTQKTFTVTNGATSGTATIYATTTVLGASYTH